MVEAPLLPPFGVFVPQYGLYFRHEHRYYTVLDLKDAFFCLPLGPQSQPIFAFEWTDPEEGESGQLTWTRLPQGFKNSPTLFDEALNQNLKKYRHSHPGVTLLQYADDLLLATGDQEKCQQATLDLLVMLDQLGYRVSAKKAQLCSSKVTYLGYNIKEDQPISNPEETLFTDESSFVEDGVSGLTPFEIMSGRLPPLLPRLREEGLAVLSNGNLLKSLQALQSSTAAARRIVRAAHQEAHPPDPDSPPACAPGDLVWVKRHDPGTLEPRWEGPFQVILSTPTAVKVGGKKRWIHRTQVKKADEAAERWTARRTESPLKRRTLPRARNPVGPLRPILQPEPPRPPKVTQAPVVTRTPGWNNTEMPKPAPGRTEAPGELRLLPETSHRGLLGTREAMFRFLSKTSPNITKGCWLCLNPEPPYYVGIGTNISFGQNASEIRNYSVQRLPEGLCVGDINPALLWRTYRGLEHA
ncbi:hypothetical protein QTO34_015292 [Cnephaeus nilssonii]|uniref:Reverse transcriptase domain-containing protein n=1 Tax=Cnephaeus nilssonii TaxID=3371016 RepID=A0AA40LSM6_CNENI|nr:hypothetical protein QTO34_015292 [Eptesicus nilssonii]